MTGEPYPTLAEIADTTLTDVALMRQINNRAEGPTADPIRQRLGTCARLLAQVIELSGGLPAEATLPPEVEPTPKIVPLPAPAVTAWNNNLPRHSTDRLVLSTSYFKLDQAWFRVTTKRRGTVDCLNLALELCLVRDWPGFTVADFKSYTGTSMAQARSIMFEQSGRRLTDMGILERFSGAGQEMLRLAAVYVQDTRLNEPLTGPPARARVIRRTDSDDELVAKPAAKPAKPKPRPKPAVAVTPDRIDEPAEPASKTPTPEPAEQVTDDPQTTELADWGLGLVSRGQEPVGLTMHDQEIETSPLLPHIIKILQAHNWQMTSSALYGRCYELPIHVTRSDIQAALQDLTDILEDYDCSQYLVKTGPNITLTQMHPQ